MDVTGGEFKACWFGMSVVEPEYTIEMHFLFPWEFIRGECRSTPDHACGHWFDFPNFSIRLTATLGERVHGDLSTCRWMEGNLKKGQDRGEKHGVKTSGRAL